MNSNQSKLLTAILAVFSIIAFLKVEFFNLFGEAITGEDLYKIVRSDNFSFHISDNVRSWMYLYIFVPIIVGVTRIAIPTYNQKLKEIFIVISFTMFIPVVAMSMNLIDAEGLKYGIGFFLYLLCSTAIVVTAFLTPATDTDSNATPENNKNTVAKKIRKYSDEQLLDIIASPNRYDNSYIDACKNEIEIRKQSIAFNEEVESYSDEKIEEVLKNESLYSEALSYCCTKEKKKRLLARKEKETSEKKAREQEQQRKKENRIAWLKKNQWYFYLSLGLLIIILFVCYLFSDGRQYKEGVSEYGNGHYDSAIKWLTKVGNNYKEAPTAKWLLYNAYMETKDSAQAAKALEQATRENDWYQQPDAYSQYIACLLDGSLEPYIERNSRHAAQLMETCYDGEMRVKAAKLYLNNNIFDEACMIIKNYADTNNADDKYVMEANACMGLFYLLGIGSVDKDIDEAASFFSSSSEPSCAEYHAISLLAVACRENTEHGIHSKMREIKDVLSEAQDKVKLTIMGETILYVASSFLKAQKKHTKEGFLTSYDDRWHSYTYNNGKGFYTGEFKGSKYFGDGGADGWGCFTNKTNKEGKLYYYLSLGEYRYLGSSCPLNGLGIIINYYPDENKILLSYGDYHSDELIKGGTWSNNDIPKFHFEVNLNE